MAASVDPPTTTPSTPRTRATTITDVARAAGVATSTVSRALSKPGRVSASTRDRIEKIAAELGYVPNSQARALTSGRTRAIAVLVSDITNPFYFGIIRGTQHQLKAAGYTQLLVDTEESGDLEENMLLSLRRSCDGAIVMASRLSDTRLASLASEIPLVVINRATPGVPNVVLDSPVGVDQALEHLASLGHRHVIYISGPRTSWSNEKRWQAMRAGAARLGLDVTRSAEFTPTTTSGAAAADAMLNSGATACIAFNDLLAIGILMRLRERGVRVPDDVSIVGCDDIFGADFCNPPLTTLTAPIEQAGRVAVSMLLSSLDPITGRHVRRSVLLPTHLTVRDSTGPAPSEKTS